MPSTGCSAHPFPPPAPFAATPDSTFEESQRVRNVACAGPVAGVSIVDDSGGGATRLGGHTPRAFTATIVAPVVVLARAHARAVRAPVADAVAAADSGLVGAIESGAGLAAVRTPPGVVARARAVAVGSVKALAVATALALVGAVQAVVARLTNARGVVHAHAVAVARRQVERTRALQPAINAAVIALASAVTRAWDTAKRRKRRTRKERGGGGAVLQGENKSS